MTLKLITKKAKSETIYGEYGEIYFKNDWWYGFIAEAEIELDGIIKRGTIIFIDNVNLRDVKRSCDFKPREEDEEDC